MMMMMQVMYVFYDCTKFTSVFTLCALSVDRFMATFHQLGRYRQLRVGVAICTSIWLACLAVSSPYWIYSNTAERFRPPLTGSDVTANTGNATAHALNEETFTENMLDQLPGLPVSNLDNDLDPDFDNDNDIVGDFGDYELDPHNAFDLLDRERSRERRVKLTCKVHWPTVEYRKTWTYAFLVGGLFVPLAAIAVFNVLLIHRMRVLNRNKQKAGVLRMRRLTSVSRMVLAVVVIFAVCQLPYHIMEIMNAQVCF